MASQTIQALVLHGPKDLRLVHPRLFLPPFSLSYRPFFFPTIFSLPCPRLTWYQETRSLSPPSPHELQIRVTNTGLCGSDLHYYTHLRNGDIQVREPLILGHEASGIVAALGSAVSTDAFKVGDAVALEVGVPCGRNDCKYCSPASLAVPEGALRGIGNGASTDGGVDGVSVPSGGRRGRYNLCPRLRFRSSAKSFPHYQGTLQTALNHPADYCHKLPDRSASRSAPGPSLPIANPHLQKTLTKASLLEPLSVALHAVRRAGLLPPTSVPSSHLSSSPSSPPCAQPYQQQPTPRPAVPHESKTILIFGAGAVGLLCAYVLRHALPPHGSHVLIADISAPRVDFAVKRRFVDQGFVVARRNDEGKEMEQERGQGVEGRLDPARDVAACIVELPRETWRRKGEVGRRDGGEMEMEGKGEGKEEEERVGQVDIAFECTGTESCMQAGIFATRPGGKVMLV
ncbi:MAG: hypothetical protein LQ340_004984, partial [Diploschistes diacapsis]